VDWLLASSFKENGRVDTAATADEPSSGSWISLRKEVLRHPRLFFAPLRELPQRRHV